MPERRADVELRPGASFPLRAIPPRALRGHGRSALRLLQSLRRPPRTAGRDRELLARAPRPHEGGITQVDDQPLLEQQPEEADQQASVRDMQARRQQHGDRADDLQARSRSTAASTGRSGSTEPLRPRTAPTGVRTTFTQSSCLCLNMLVAVAARRRAASGGVMTKLGSISPFWMRSSSGLHVALHVALAGPDRQRPVHHRADRELVDRSRRRRRSPRRCRRCGRPGSPRAARSAASVSMPHRLLGAVVGVQRRRGRAPPCRPRRCTRRGRGRRSAPSAPPTLSASS